MNFFETNFTKHYFWNKPHKWFLAFLLSPIHFAEMHYKKKYHLNFVHAKKLFIFDITLLLSIIIIFSASIFWWTYDPTITDLIYININQNDTKIKSGDYITYNINYKNESTVKIKNPILKIDLPEGFIFDKSEPYDFDQNLNQFTLKDLGPNKDEKISISGWFYGTPNEHYFIHTTLSYNQEDRKKTEEKYIPLITIPRDSVLETKITANKNIIYLGNTEISYIIKNTGKLDIKNIEINLDNEYIKNDTENNIIKIENLAPDEEYKLKTNLNLKDTKNASKITYSVTPSIMVNEKEIDQKTVEHEFNILHPRLEMKTAWENNNQTLKPGETILLNLAIKNTGDTNLNNLELVLPIDKSVINLEKMMNLNKNSKYINNNLEISDLSNLKNLKINESTNINIYVPVLNYPQGTDILLALTPIIKSNITDTEFTFDTETKTSEIKIGTNIKFDKTINYYTSEGDQIGRGPNPPQINKESKYWVFLEIENTSSKINNLKLNTTLANNIIFTGKTSVSKGDNIIYNKTNNNIYWKLYSLNPHEKVGIYFKIAFTPQNSDELDNITILKNINLKTFDTYIEESLELYQAVLVLNNN